MLIEFVEHVIRVFVFFVTFRMKLRITMCYFGFDAGNLQSNNQEYRIKNKSGMKYWNSEVEV